MVGPDLSYVADHRPDRQWHLRHFRNPQSVSPGSIMPAFALEEKSLNDLTSYIGYDLNEHLARLLREAGYDVMDFGDDQPTPDDDYPDYVVPLARAVGRGEVDRGVAICGSGVGASIVANKVAEVRACLIHDTFSAHQGVEDDDLNMLCLGGLVVGHALAWESVHTFLAARFSGAERHRRRLATVAELEQKETHLCTPIQ